MSEYHSCRTLFRKLDNSCCCGLKLSKEKKMKKILHFRYCISDIVNWMLVNKLNLNDSKTELFVVASPHSLRNLPDLKLKVGDVFISPSITVKNLGVLLDREMSMSDRVSQICTTATFNLRNIS